MIWPLPKTGFISFQLGVRGSVSKLCIFSTSMKKDVCDKMQSAWLTAGLLCCGVGLIRSIRAVWFAVTHFGHWYTCRWGRTSPLTGITVSRVGICTHGKHISQAQLPHIVLLEPQKRGFYKWQWIYLRVYKHFKTITIYYRFDEMIFFLNRTQLDSYFCNILKYNKFLL